jgi:hypothetical protein
MFSFLGRGIFYIFIGSVIVGERWFRIVPGTIVGIIGVGYAALEFIPSIEPPANMRYVQVVSMASILYTNNVPATPTLGGVLNKFKPAISGREDSCRRSSHSIRFV